MKYLYKMVVSAFCRITSHLDTKWPVTTFAVWCLMSGAYGLVPVIWCLLSGACCLVLAVCCLLAIFRTADKSASLIGSI